ncbi:hypothetical protein JCM3766R1_001267 [Sporobolomyces carnicolor]
MSTSPVTKPRSMLRRLFSSSSPSDRPQTKSSEVTSHDVFSQIMALNARHGHPSVQAYSVETRPVGSSKLQTKSSPSPSSTKKAKTKNDPLPPPYDAFDEIMRLNARHGHPSVQAHFVR